MTEQIHVNPPPYFSALPLVQTWYLKKFFLILLIYFHLYFINSKSCFEEYLLFLNQTHLEVTPSTAFWGSPLCPPTSEKATKVPT